MFEKQVSDWPEVKAKKKFGCPCYDANNKLFAFLVTEGIVLTQLTQPDKDSLTQKHGAGLFGAGKKFIRSWVKIPVKTETELEQIKPYIRKSYEAALHSKP